MKAGFMRNKQIDVKNAIKAANFDGEPTFDQVRQSLKRWSSLIPNCNILYIMWSILKK